LGFTNGYIGSLCIIMVNERVDEHEKGIAGYKLFLREK
jgi:hypothetical protein